MIPSTQDSSEEITLLSVINLTLRHRRTLVLLPLLSIGVAVLIWVLRAHTYEAEAVIKPEAAKQTSGLFAVAAQLGMRASSGTGESLDFYAQLLTSPELLRAAAATEYIDPDAGSPGDTVRSTLVELYAAPGTTEEDRLRSATAILRTQVEAEVSPTAGLVSLVTRAPAPELAVALNRRLLDLLSDFNLRKRQSQASAERRFLQERVAEARQELGAAERRLERFLEQNRVYAQSPQLAFAAARLEREVALQQKIFTELSASFEQARIEEIRNTPFFTLVVRPEITSRSTKPSLPLVVVLAGFIGLGLAFGWAVVRQALSGHEARDPRRYAEFQQLRSAAARDFLRGPLLGRLRRGNGAAPGTGARPADERGSGAVGVKP